MFEGRPPLPLEILQAACLAGFLLLAPGCSPGAPAENRPLWSGEASWAPVEGGWVRGVPLEEPKTFAAAGADRFRAVLFPPAGRDAALILTTPGGSAEVLADAPVPVDLELGGAREATLSATAEVRLLRPRLVSGKRPRGRRILLAVADTLRFDHADAERMPETWSYFADGTRFLHAYSPASWTLPSLASVFTGRLPAQLRSPDGTLISLSPGTETIASKLAHRGFATVAVNANYTVNHENGFSAGFDLFYAPSPRLAEAAAEEDFPDAGEIAGRALRAAAWLADEDLFLYLQFMDPHEPYRDHEAGRKLNALASGVDPDPGALADLRAAYASEVRHLDRRLGPLLRELGELDLAVFTSDHGEELFEHRGYRHGPTLYEEVVRVPLWIRGAGVPRRTVAEPVSLVALKDFILGGAEALRRPPERVTMETFSFGPPRWSTLLDERRLIYFARDLEPPADEPPTARWIRESHPRMSFTTLEGDRPVDPDPELVDRSIRLLLEHFAGFRRGLYLLFRNRERFELRVSGVGGAGLVWGEAGHLDVEDLGGGEVRIEVRGPRPFALLFLPAAGTSGEGGEPLVTDLGSGAAVPLRSDVREAPAIGVTAWFDPGRPPAVLRGTEETLKRLEALGYI